MNTSLLMVYICTTLIIFLPYLWFIVIGNKNEKKQEQFFSKTFLENNINLSVKEQWNKTLIGVDETKNVLFYSKYNDENPIVKIYNLKQIKECTVKIKTQEIKLKDKIDKKLQSVELVLILFEQNEKVELNFFNRNDLEEEDLDIYRAEKWKSIIENILPKPKHFKRAA